MGRSVACVSRGYRSNLAIRFAETVHLQRFTYSCHLGAWGVPRGLKRREIAYLEAFGVLVRSGDLGYLGVRAPMAVIGAFAATVANAGQGSGSRGSASTARRALAGLEAAGFVELSTYGGGRPRKLPDAGGGFFWTRDQITVVRFTEKLTGLFRCRRGSPLSVGLSECHTDEGRKVPEGETSSSSCSPPVGSVDPVRVSSGVPAADGGEDDLAGRTAPAGEEETGPAPLSAPLPALRHERSREGETRKARANRSRFPSGAGWYTRGGRGREILAFLVLVTAKRGREGRALVARAALEIADPCAGQSVPWDFWCGRWGLMTYNERAGVVRREILPAISARVGASSPAAPAPAAPAPAAPAPAAPAPAFSGGPDRFLDALESAAAAGNALAIRYLASRKNKSV